VRAYFLGVRGSTPAPGESFVRYGGHTSCVAIAHDDSAAPTLILDSGTGIRRLSALLGGEAFAGTILLTHLHWDHVHGLPFFQAADREDARAELFLPEQPDGGEAADVLAQGMSPPHFPIEPDELRGKWSFATLSPGPFEAEGFSLEAREIPHKGGRTYGYRVSDGTSVLTYMPDHCPGVMGPGPEGWGEYHLPALELARGSDALVHDAQFTGEETAAAVFFGHSTAEYAVELARRAQARRVVLFHHQPDRSDEALDRLAERFAPDPPVTIASESLVLEL
jgi:phosphoribosyl 1,2-cyclic phosphodiesterase